MTREITLGVLSATAEAMYRPLEMLASMFDVDASAPLIVAELHERVLAALGLQQAVLEAARLARNMDRADDLPETRRALAACCKALLDLADHFDQHLYAPHILIDLDRLRPQGGGDWVEMTLSDLIDCRRAIHTASTALFAACLDLAEAATAAIVIRSGPTGRPFEAPFESQPEESKI